MIFDSFVDVFRVDRVADGARQEEVMDLRGIALHDAIFKRSHKASYFYH